MTDFSYRTATQLLDQLHRGETSSKALLEHHIERVLQLDHHINAVVIRTFDAARERAAEADAARARGEIWGPLHGLPMTVAKPMCLLVWPIGNHSILCMAPRTTPGI